jgi:hypothetical protein
MDGNRIHPRRSKKNFCAEIWGLNFTEVEPARIGT